jgi:hypothetical protein
MAFLFAIVRPFEGAQKQPIAASPPGAIPVLDDFDISMLDAIPMQGGFDIPDFRGSGGNISDVSKYLEERGYSDQPSIRLPGNKSFNSFGDPMIIGATDYSRSISPR